MATRRAVERLVRLFFLQQNGENLADGEEVMRSRVSLYDLVLIRAQDTVKEARNRDPAVQALLEMAKTSVDYASASVPLPMEAKMNEVVNDSTANPVPHSRKRQRNDATRSTAPPTSVSSPPAHSTARRTSTRARTRRPLSKNARVQSTSPPIGPPPFKRQRLAEPSTQPPSIEYNHENGGLLNAANVAVRETQGDCRGHRRKIRYKENKNRISAETYTSKSLNVEDLPLSSTGWMGTLYDASCGNILRAAHKGGAAISRYLTNVTMVPYGGLATRITDSEGRLIIFRSQISKNMAELMPAFIEQAANFVGKCTPMPASARKGNKRGQHWFCIAGVDRNLKEVPSYSEWHRIPENKAAIEEAFLPGTPFSNINGQANDVCAAAFPGIAKRYEVCAKTIYRKFSLTPMFGLFWNWCLNAALPSDGVKRVFCDPHVDWKNIALGVCIIFVYGVFNHREKAWLVIWEANVCLELPPGVFLAYSSSLFLHFSVDVKDISLVTTDNGEIPTPSNSRPLNQKRGERPEHVSEEDWDMGNGRGSVVWFNQASMFQTAETGFDTLTLAREAGHTGNCDVNDFLYGVQPVFAK